MNNFPGITSSVDKPVVMLILSTGLGIEEFILYPLSVYLMHHDALAGVKYLNQKNFMNKTGLEIITLALILSYFCGMCFYHFIEVPSMNVGNYVIDKISSSKCFKRPIVTDALEPLIPISLTDEELK